MNSSQGGVDVDATATSMPTTPPLPTAAGRQGRESRTASADRHQRQGRQRLRLHRRLSGRRARRNPQRGDQSRRPHGRRQPLVAQQHSTTRRPGLAQERRRHPRLDRHGRARSAARSQAAAGRQSRTSGKPEGGVSQLDIANSLRFNNALSLITLTPQQLLEVLEHAVVGDRAGRHPRSVRADRRHRILVRCYATAQVLSPARRGVTPGDRIRSLSIDENGEIIQTLVENGEVVAGAPRGDPRGHAELPDRRSGRQRWLRRRQLSVQRVHRGRTRRSPTASISTPMRPATTTSAHGPVWRPSPTTAASRTRSPNTWRTHYSVTPSTGGYGPGAGHPHPEPGVPGRYRARQRRPDHRRRSRVTVNEGHTVVITTADLNEADPDHSGAPLTYTVTGTVRGNVLVNGIVATSFTQADLAAGLVSFRHDGSGSTDASFTVTLQDAPGLTSAPATVVVDVIGDNDAPVFTSPVVVLDPGEQATVATMTATDPDGDPLTFAIAGGTDAALLRDQPEHRRTSVREFAGLRDPRRCRRQQRLQRHGLGHGFHGATTTQGDQRRASPTSASRARPSTAATATRRSSAPPATTR